MESVQLYGYVKTSHARKVKDIPHNYLINYIDGKSDHKKTAYLAYPFVNCIYRIEQLFHSASRLTILILAIFYDGLSNPCAHMGLLKNKFSPRSAI